MRDTLDVLTHAKRRLEGRLRELQPAKRRRKEEKNSILKYCQPNPAPTVIKICRRLEQSLGPERWPQLSEVGDLLASPTRFAGLQQCSLPAQRVVLAALLLESRNAHISRIRSVVIADAIDTYINNTGSARTELQSALRHLAGESNVKHLKSLGRWRETGEWLIDFFQHIPLGAIFMMDGQTTMYVSHRHLMRHVGLTRPRWGNVIGKGYVVAVVRYCRSLPGFVSHAQRFTPMACQAIRSWADGCEYHLHPESSLAQLINAQEKGHALTDTAPPMSHPPTVPEAAIEVSFNEPEEVSVLPESDDVAPASRHRTFREASGSGVGSQVRPEARKTSFWPLVDNDREVGTVMPSTRKSATRNQEASRGGEHFLSPAFRISTAPTTRPSQGLEVGTTLGDKAVPRRAPSPPRVLLIQEQLLRHTKLYFEYSCRKMTFDANEILLSPGGTEFRNDLCAEFDSYCFTATMFHEKGLLDESRRALSRASALVVAILRAEHPRTLACFFEVLMHLIQIGLPDVAFLLRRFIQGMSAEIGREGNLWTQICQLLGELDQGSLADAMAQAWRCTTEVFDDKLGPSHRFAVSVRLDYFKRVITDELDEERLLRGALAQLGDTPRLSTPRVMLNLAHNLSRQGRHREAETVGQQIWSKLHDDGMYAGRIAERIDSLKVISHSRFNQGKTLKAESTLREAIRMIVDQWGERHSWALEFRNVLEGWLRAWGREVEADTLREEIGSVLGKDDIDDSFDGVQGSLVQTRVGDGGGKQSFGESRV